MRRERLLRYLVRSESAEVDDAPYPGRVRLQGEGPGRSAVGVLETGTGPERVHQVVRHIDAAQGGGDRLGVGDIPAHRLDIPRPGVIPQFPRERARQRTRWPAWSSSGTRRPPM